MTDDLNVTIAAGSTQRAVRWATFARLFPVVASGVEDDVVGGSGDDAFVVRLEDCLDDAAAVPNSREVLATTLEWLCAADMGIPAVPLSDDSHEHQQLAADEAPRVPAAVCGKSREALVRETLRADASLFGARSAAVFCSVVAKTPEAELPLLLASLHRVGMTAGCTALQQQSASVLAALIREDGVVNGRWTRRATESDHTDAASASAAWLRSALHELHPKPPTVLQIVSSDATAHAVAE